MLDFYSCNLFLSYIIIFMQKIRDLYKETQKNAVGDFAKVTHERMKNISALCSKQFDSIISKNDFTNLDELTFYREKFGQIVDIFNQSTHDALKKSKIQDQIIAKVKDNFVPQGEKMVPLERQDMYLNNVEQALKNRNIKSSQHMPPRDIIQNFFDDKKTQIQKSKIGFKSVLEGIPYAPKKFAVKSSETKKVNIPNPLNKAQEIRTLQSQIERLRGELAEKNNQKEFNMQLLQLEKKDYEDRIKDLIRELEELQFQNSRLKQQSVKNYPMAAYDPIYASQIGQYQHYQEIQHEQYEPYQIKFRENDINKIKNKVVKETSNFQHIDRKYPKTYNHFIKDQSERYTKKSQNLEFNHHIISAQSYNRKYSQLVQKTSNQKSVTSAKDIAIKSKVSFFKPSIVLYKSDDFQIAVKSVDLIRLQVKKISIFVNNKSNLQKGVSFQYKYDPKYYQVIIRKKLNVVEGLNQGKEEVEVKLLNQTDLDSIIEVRMVINISREINFLLPAMFIQFLQKRPQSDKSIKYTTQQVNPIYKFASLHSAQQFIPLEQLYDRNYEQGRVYAVSKYYEGYIYLRWVGGKVEIETIYPWILFLSYLLFRQY